MSSRMRVTKGHSGNRRAHHSLNAVRTSTCSNCGAVHERHKVCLDCGFYRGKEILQVNTKENLATTVEENTKEKIGTKTEEKK